MFQADFLLFKRWNLAGPQQDVEEQIYEINQNVGLVVNNNIDPGLQLWNEDFSHRPSWCDARLTLKQIKNVRNFAKFCPAVFETDKNFNGAF